LRRWRFHLATLVMLLAMALAAHTALAQPQPPPKPPFPGITLPERAQGERAISLLGARLPEVAAWYGMSTAEFARMLRFDRTVWLDRTGRVFFEEEVRVPAGGTTMAPAPTDPLSPTLAPLDQTFKLHSRPGAKRTIYLNFVGATLTGTAWNTSTRPTITALPFDLDGVPYSFSTAELERIQYIWKRVAEDYSAFDVDVTTEPPPADRLTRSSSSDDTFGTTVLITKRANVYDCSCGGVAYLTAFDDTTEFYKPALVFYDALGSGNEKYVADAISHEAGHNVGLSHDGTSTAGYYQGHGSGATGWAPIMGVGYYQQLVQWSKGEYADANNKQDDYVVMQNTGLPIRPDDHGNTTATATPLASSTANGITTVSGSGVIERPADVDVFSFVAGAGSASITVSPAPRGPKLDILATLRDAAGNVLATSNPVDSLPATLAANLPAPGTYFVTVDGVGKGDPLATGYTDYGSIGQYTISGTATPATSQPPTAALAASPTSGVVPLTVNFSAAGSTDADGMITSYAWNFGDGGSQTGGVTAQRTYVTPGSYTATVTVTDNSGLTAARSVTINAQAPASVATMYVANIAMSLRTFKNGNADALASVTVRDNSGNAVSGATITGVWSGVVNGSQSLLTNSSGQADFRSARVRADPGSKFTFTVTGVTLSGYSYNPAANVETTDSVTR
jgi:PKD repeat protein